MARPHRSSTRTDGVLALSDGRTLTLGAEIGRGSSGSVFRAGMKLSFGVERHVAVKVFDALSSDDQEVLETLARAARRAALVRHPNVADVYELGIAEGARPYVLCELVDGPSLEALTASYAAKGLRVPLDLALFIGVEIAEALAGARAAEAPDGARLGLVHGDLSPREVLLSPSGEVKVTDFGFASAVRAASSVRTFASVTKRAATLAPEVIAGEDPGGRSDVFSLGVILWEMLIGPRFPGNLDDAATLAYAREGYVHSTVFDPQLPAFVRTVLQRALEPSPRRRYAHAGALAYELRRGALAMGVGDGRVFLRHALRRLSGEDDADVVTREVSLDGSAKSPPPVAAPREAAERRSGEHPVSGTVRRVPPASEPGQ